jgi:hypothetical protein
MKRGKIVRILVVAILFTLLMGIVPGTPVLAAPILNVSPVSGAIGTMVTVTGENFDSYIGDDIFIFFDDEELTVSPITVPPAGTFSFDFNIPEEAEPGRHTIRAKYGTSTVTTSLFTVLEAEIRLDTKTGVVGTAVTISGKGFYADRVVTFYYDSRMLGTEAATAIGEFSYSFTVPDSTAGEHTIVAKDAEGNSTEAEFEVIPSITLNPTSGAVGSILLVSGTGFGRRNNLGVYFKYDLVAYAKANELGRFEVAFFNVPSMPPGTYDVTVEDAEGNMGKAEFTIIAGARLDKTEANVGTELTISGTGFIVGGTITIKYDDVAFVRIIADSNGAFKVVFRVPVDKYGQHVLTVTDGVNTQQLAFAIESEAPPIPTPLLPSDGSEVKADAHFDWEDVDDPSLPITYRFQVGSDEDFTTILLEKQRADSEYTLTKEERLAAVKKEAPYYWRVKAIDSASNESDWSTLNSFLVMAPPAPELLLPEMDTEAEAEVYFDWKDVTSLSPPITYYLQVGSDEDFTTILLEKQLADSEYTLTEEEKLAAVKKEVPYYWRVKAIDETTNESDWSIPESFHVGFSFALPGWAIFTLIGIGAVLIGFLAFWFGRRTAYSES